MSLTRAEVNRNWHDPAEIGSGNTADYVVAHAKRQERKGKNPSVSYKGILNPQQALEAARADIEARTDPQGLWDGWAWHAGRVVMMYVVSGMDLPVAHKLARQYIEEGAVGVNIQVGEDFNPPRRPFATDFGILELPYL